MILVKDLFGPAKLDRAMTGRIRQIFPLMRRPHPDGTAEYFILTPGS